MHAYRTHTCGQLRADHAGETVRVSGWVHRKRDHGDLVFIDLRDHYGMVQIVTEVDGPVFSVIDSLRACGLRLSMDGFGTGSSSLSCLRSHAFDSVKVAQSSMRDLASNRDALEFTRMATPVTVSGGAPPLARPAESTKSVFAGTSLACLSATRLSPSLTRPAS